MSNIFKSSKSRRITGFLTAVILVLTLSPAEALVALAEMLTGGLTITGDSGWIYENNVLTITGGGSYTISGTTTTDRVVISAGEAVEVTAEGLSITSSGGSPFEITGTGDVNLILSGENVFKSEDYGCAGLQKTETSNTLTISSISGNDKADTLTATGASGDGEIVPAAGIGGGDSGNDCSNITINGGTIKAEGYAAGIGGSGYSGNCSNITINGGIVEATGIYGAGIGGGLGGSGSNITINGGTVTAIGGEGAGIGGTYNGNGENIVINGGTVTANGGYGAAGIGGGDYGSGSSITINGGTVTANSNFGAAVIGGGERGNGENITISGGYITLSKGNYNAVYIGGGETDGETGTVTITGGYFAQGDTDYKTVYDVEVADGCQVIENPIESTKSAYPYVVNNGKPLQITGDSGYTYSDNVLTISSGGTYRVSMSAGYTATSTDRIVIDSADTVNVTISGLDITTIAGSAASPFDITGSGDVNLLLQGDNTFTSFKSAYPNFGNYPGLQKTTTDNTLTIASHNGLDAGGSLTATGGDYAAGIGGGYDGSGSNIVIESGTITAESLATGAGIGGGNGGSGSNITITGGIVTATGGGAGIGGGGYRGSGSNITISGGSVTATSSGSGAGIGGGDSGSGSDITISGGSVTATSSSSGAGIGGGREGSGRNITISGGTITAIGGKWGAGIGGGYRGSGSEITIEGGTVEATGGDYAAGIGGGIEGSGSDITISGGYITLSKGDEAAYIGGGLEGSTGTVTITGGYFGEGVLTTADTAGSVYGTAVGSGYQVLANEDTATKGTYPYYVYQIKDFVISAADGGTITENKDYTYTGGVLTVINGGSYKIAMNKAENIISTDTDRIVIDTTNSTTSEDVTLTITDINVTSSTNSPFRADKGNLTLILEGKNVLTSTVDGYAGLTKETTDYTLTITSIDGDGKTEGSLEATGGGKGAGIGGGYGSKGANIEIDGGTITAIGGGNGSNSISDSGSGIGGGSHGIGENITISGGVVSATGGGVFGAGIGGGSQSNGNSITITGGTITATGGSDYGAGIGGGWAGSGSDITITGGYITLSKGSSGYNVAAYIGGGSEGSTGTVTITGGYFGEGVLTTADTAGSVYETAVGSNCSVLANEDTGTMGTYPYYVCQIKAFVITAADDRTITEDTDYTYTGGVLTIIEGGSYKIAMNTDGNITSTDTDRIVINSEDDVKLTITDINVTSSTNSPFRADKGNLTLILEGKNVLTSTMENYPGLTKETTDYTLTITSTEDADGNEGSLEATGGDYGSGIGGGDGGSGSSITIKSGTVTAKGGYGSGIGGGFGGSGSNITISGGTVTATGGHGSGIGGGYGGNGSNITISGGTVTATGGSYDIYGGSGIGGGSWGDGDSITISGGTVTANGGTNAAAIGGGDYDSRYGGNGSNIVISGGYILLSKASSDAAYIGGGTDGNGNSGSATDISISGGYFGQGDLTAQVVYEAAVASGSVVAANDDATYPFCVHSPNAFVITANDENGYTYTDRVLTILQGGTYTIAMNTAEGIYSTSTDRIVVNSTDDITLTIEKINVTSSTNSPFRAESGNLTLYLSGDNYLTSTAGNYAGLSKAEGDYSLEITDSSSGGSLTAAGGADGAGIGGDKYVSVGNITINGATVTATGSANGAGIGGGYDGTGSSITITGGSVVTAAGGTYGAGIGGGKFKNGTNISIDGSETVVYAYGDYAAGIGGGQVSEKDSIGGNITISGGTVTATSSRGAGIGGGYSNGTSSTGSNITISGGTVTASSTHKSKSGAAIGSGGSYSEANGIASGITITGGYLTLSSASGDIIGVGANGGTVGNISITGGYFGNGDTENQTVYGTAVDSDCEVYSNSDADTAAYYPVYVAKGAAKPFVISAAEGELDPSSYTYTKNVLTITAGGSYKIAMNTAEGITSTDTDRIVINSTDDVTLTISDINVTSSTNSPFRADKGNLNLILEGENSLTSTKENYPGLTKETTEYTLTITGIKDDNGKVGSLAATGAVYGAGIGGGNGQSGSNITISSGTITANGGSGGAGIGGGNISNGSNITISGGTVTANGGSGGAGIGGGLDGSGDYISITTGDVTANGGSGGAGIGGGRSFDVTVAGSNITISGGTVTAIGGSIYAAGIGGGSCNTNYGGSIGSNITISGGYITISKGSDEAAYIGGGYSISGNGSSTSDITITGGYFGLGDLDAQTVYETAVADKYYVYNNNDTETNALYPYWVAGEQKAFLITSADENTAIAENTDYTYTGNILTILTGGSYKIAMNTALGTSTSTDRIVINSADEVNVTVEKVQITATSGGSPFSITGSGNVNLIISGKNIFTSTALNYAGLQKTTETNTLTISSKDSTDDSLEANGSSFAAGIGGGGDEKSGSNITIESGIIKANGGLFGAGIGGGYSSSGSSITIEGGTVEATGGQGGAGIGGGYGGISGGYGSNITIENGTVTATGGSYAAGIGGGEGGSGSNITIEGGTVEVNGKGEGTLGGASIGGGRGDTGTGSNITISGGYITLSKESNAAAYIGGGASSTTDAETISITGGYFGLGDVGKQTVYETMPTVDYQVYTNSDTSSMGTYPVYVAAATDPAYTIWAEVTDTVASYNPGDVINADIYVSAVGGASLDAFTISLDSSLYTVTAAAVSDSITASIGENNIISASGLTSEVAESGTKVVSVKLTVNTGITTAEDIEIAVNTAKTTLTPVNRSTGFTPALGISDTVNLYNITLAFKAGNAVFNSDSTAAELTAYLRYGETGLYTSDSYDTAFTVPTVTVENTAYRLEDDSWILYIDRTAQTGTLTAADLEAYTISDGKAYYVTPSLIGIISVTITPAETSQGTIYYDGTAVEANTVKYFDSGTTIKDVTDLITFTPAQGAYYSLAGWYVNDTLVTDYTTVLTGGEVLKPYITTDTYGWSENVTGKENIAFENLAGAYNNVVTYGTDITFSLNPKEGYKVYSVYYTIGTGTAVELTAVNGVYTISGSDISGDVTLNVTVKQYHTITFEAGTGTEMTKITAYAWSGEAGLYSSLEGLGDSTYSLTAKSITDTVTALPDYDLATDTAGDGLWSSGGVVYTTDAVLATAFSADTAFTANASAKDTAAYKAWIKVIDTDTNYNVGDTINADIYISADSEANADKVKIALNEDWFTISEVSVGENASYTNAGNVITAENLNTTVTTGGTAVISLKLTVNSDITTNEAAEITIDEDLSYITPYGRTVQVKPEAGAAAQVSIYNITLTFKPGNAVFNGDSSITALTAYMRYNEAGLYTTNGYGETFSIPTVTVENTAYKLNEGSWILYIDGMAQENTLTAADLAAYTISNDKTYEVMPSVTEQISVTIAPAEASQGTIYYDGTAVEANTVKYFDSGTTIKDVTDLITFTPAQGAYYSLAGWYVNDTLVTDYTTVLTGGEVLKPYITTDTYGWSENVTGKENIAFENLAGAYNNVVTYGTDITFSLNPKDGYKVYSVYYTIGTGTAVELTAVNGVYTISGSDISGDVTLNVTVKQYHTITFEAGTGTEMTKITAYAWSGEAGLYSSLEGLGDSTYSLTAKSITDTVSALPDYDLATDSAGDGLWSSGGVVYTTAAVLATAFSADTAFTANATAKNTAAYKAWVKVIDTDTNYNVGDTINADIYISADSEANVDKVKIALNEDWFTISEVSVGGNTSYTNAGNVITAENLNTTVTTGGTAVISLKLTVNSDITTNEAAEITIDEDLSYITPYGRTVQVKPEAGTAAQVSIYNITLTFKPGNAVFNGDSSITALTAYMRYNEAGLYITNGYTTAFEIPTVTVENTAYRLNEDSWILYIDGTAQDGTLTAADLASYTISNDKTYEVTPSITEQITVTINPADSAYGVISYNGTAVETSITNTFDSGITLEDISNLITFETAGDTSYSLSGWYLNGSETPVLAAKYVVTAITADTTLAPYITANKFDWSSSVTNGSVENLTGVEGTTVTYGNDITFTLTPKDGYKVYSVYYTVEGNNSVQLTETNGVYTIPGKAVVNNVSLDVTINKYHTITFGAGTGTVMTEITAYAWSGIAGLYSSADNLGQSAYSLTVSDITRGLTAESGYRLAADTVGDELWTEGTVLYTTAAVLEEVFTADTAFTANAVKQYKVIFEAGENGSISGTTEITVDSGKSISDMGGTLPTAEANSNYVFKGWFINEAETAEADILAMKITDDITVTAEFTEASYSVTFAETPAGTFSDISGATEENGSYTAVYNTDVTFTFMANDDYEIAEIYFTVDGVKHSLNANSSGSYTIPGSDITGTISVIVESSATRTFTFTVNSESGGSITGTTAFTLLLGKYLTEEQINSISVIAPTGYSFRGWRITAESNVYNSSLDSSTSTDLAEKAAEEVIIADDNLSGSAVEIEESEPVEEQKATVETIPSVNVSLASLVSDRIYTTDELVTIEADRNITFEAVFDLTDYSVSDENSAVTITDGVDDGGNAHYGTDITFTLTGDKIISYVGYKTGENGTEVKLTADENGVFTIPGSSVTENIYIITTVVSNIEITFISHDDYLGEAVTAGEGRKIALLSADLLDSGTYALTSGREFLYSEKYGAYVMWVDEDITTETLSAEITINLNSTTAYVDYSGDINGSGSTTEADAGMLNDILANNWTKDVTDSQLFSLDVEQAEAPKQIYTSDAVWILLNSTGTDD